MKHITLLLALLVSVVACAQPTQIPQTTEMITDVFSYDVFAPVKVPELPKSLDFAGEPVPLENYDTRESLQRELMTNVYLHARTLQVLMAATRYFPIIEPIMEKYGIPDDMKYLCVAESALNPNAGSSAGAAGLWQLMPAYGKQAGLFIGGGVDERYHIEKSTEAACKYLLDAKKKFGNWTMAAASYNVGMAGVQRRMDKQDVQNYYDLYLPEETMRYIFRILAFKIIMPDPYAYGFEIPSSDYQKPLTEYKEVTVTGAKIDWASEARKQGTNYKMLRQLNHWIRDYDYNGASRSFVIKVPVGDFRK